MRLKRPSHRGFTLLELGVVIGIITVLSAAVLPSVLEAARTRMASRAAEEVQLIQEAARWYYLNPAAFKDPTWPGQLAGTCTQTKDPLQELIDSGAVARSAPDPANPAAAATLRNPWNQPYLTRLATSMAGGTADGCMLQVSNWVQTNVAPAFADSVQGSCNDGADTPCGATPPAPQGEFRWCCAFTARPAGMSTPGCVFPNTKLQASGSTVSCALP